jgi:hypothetical protein
MTPHAALRERYLRDEPTLRLGGLAANLARVESFSQHSEHKEAVAGLLEESAFFIEWTASDVSDETCVALAELQRLLVDWRRAWDSIWADRDRRAQVAAQAGKWSQRILRLAGLLPA